MMLMKRGANNGGLQDTTGRCVGLSIKGAIPQHQRLVPSNSKLCRWANAMASALDCTPNLL